MTRWLNHPSYVPTRDSLSEKLKYKFLELKFRPAVVFLCGAKQSAPRDTLRRFLLRRAPSEVLIFYAEEVWERSSRGGDRTLLELEAELADMADVVVIVVESPGTFAELGAFSLSEELRRKLLPIVDAEHEGCDSFLAHGPLSWIDKESEFRPTIYVRHDSILEEGDTILDRIRTVSKDRSPWSAWNTPIQSLYLLVDLVSVIWPCTMAMIQHYMKNIALATFDPSKLKQTIDLAMAMGLINFISSDEGVSFYFRTDPAPFANPFHNAKQLSLPMQRARHLSAVQQLPNGTKILAHIQAKR